MKVIIDRDQEIHTDRMEIMLGDSQFNIYVDKFNNLIINKSHFGSKSGALKITPHTSNEIEIE